jgi:hypothetical protein
MPTYDQLEELIAKTTYEWTTINGVNGGKFTAKNGSGNYIFIPAAGFYDNGSLIDVGNGGYVWGSFIEASGVAYDLDFFDAYSGVDVADFKIGNSVRPVIG